MDRARILALIVGVLVGVIFTALLVRIVGVRF
jgi:xanthosine utilization system XapX-like protein